MRATQGASRRWCEYYLDILTDNPKTTQIYRDLAALEAGRPQEAEADLVKGLAANWTTPRNCGGAQAVRLCGMRKDAMRIAVKGDRFAP